MARGEAEQGAALCRGEPACWESLPVDLTQLVAARVLAAGGFLDYVRFRAVCSPWRAATPCPRGRGLLEPRFHPRGRWVMFPEGFGRFPGHRSHGGHARFFDLATAGVFVRVPLTLLSNHCVLDSPDGLLLLQRDGDTAVRLLHPFTGDVAEFPPLDRLAHQLHHLEFELTADPLYNFNRWMYNTKLFSIQARKACAAVNVADEGIVTVMLALEKIGRVAFAAAGDGNWAISSWKESQLDNTLSFRGKLHVVNCRDGLTHVSVIDPPPLMQLVPPPRTIATCSSEEIYLPTLVELDSELMLVGYNDSSLSHILVLRLADLASGRTLPLASIGDHVLFIGARSLCVSSCWLPSIGGNSIVCFHAGENYLAQYNLVTGCWSPASDGHLMLGPPLRPCTLIHHIFTCCYRQFW